MQKGLSREQVSTQLRGLGLSAGDVVFVHSSLRSMGYVEDGAETVVDALMEVLGLRGTLVAPTFTFARDRSERPVLDMERDRSGMGRITEVVRTRPGALRSRHLLHSVAALGARAQEVISCHGPSAWAADGPFWKLYELNAKILLLGVPYLRCTFFHMLEQMVQVSYRQWIDIEAHVREQDGSEQKLPTQIFVPKSGFAGNDFNKLGNLLEERGVAQAESVGNAVARLFRARHALDVGLAEYRKDPLLFVMTGRQCATLRDGVLTTELHNEKSVLDPGLIYGGS